MVRTEDIGTLKVNMHQHLLTSVTVNIHYCWRFKLAECVTLCACNELYLTSYLPSLLSLSLYPTISHSLISFLSPTFSSLFPFLSLSLHFFYLIFLSIFPFFFCLPHFVSLSLPLSLSVLSLSLPYSTLSQMFLSLFLSLCSISFISFFNLSLTLSLYLVLFISSLCCFFIYFSLYFTFFPFSCAFSLTLTLHLPLLSSSLPFSLFYLATSHGYLPPPHFSFIPHSLALFPF